MYSSKSYFCWPTNMAVIFYVFWEILCVGKQSKVSSYFSQGLDVCLISKLMSTALHFFSTTSLPHFGPQISGDIDKLFGLYTFTGPLLGCRRHKEQSLLCSTSSLSHPRCWASIRHTAMPHRSTYHIVTLLNMPFLTQWRDSGLSLAVSECEG